MSALLNGRPAPGLALHRGLHYGDGVFRTCLIYNSQVIDFDMQCDVMNSDAARLGMAPAPLAELRREAAQLAAGQGRGVLKMILLRGGASRGYRPERAEADRLLCRYDPPALRAEAWEHGVRVFRSSFALATQSALAGIKHLNRLEQVLASRDWEQGMDEALLSDAAGRPVCGTRSNLFWVRGGVLHTPALERCGVAGLMRRKVLAVAAELKLTARVGDFSWDDLEAADEMFLTNSLIGIWPVANCGSWARKPGALTQRLAERLRHPRLVAA
ncbi:MAG: aminodeoxychorismate lyase [Gammaproteobacteria bacterium]